MLFNTPTFPVFLLIVLFAFHLSPEKWKRPVLLVASYVFYSFWNWKFTFLLMLSTVIDYHCALRIADARDAKRKRTFLLVSLTSNLGILGFFKYYNFFAESTAALLASMGLHAGIPTIEIILPVGISFYTFQAISYTVDVWRGKLTPTRSPLDFALYVAFFPQLVAGPIERAQTLLPQLTTFRRLDESLVWQGAVLVAAGYLKKVVLSDQIAPFADHAFSNWSTLSSTDLWEGMFLFSLQIYFDFSGYTDIARGVAKWFGVDLMLNFRQPYFAPNITEFWHRWHISLSTWLKEYLYIPLGGNRRGTRRTYFNLMATMFLGGLWHGANFTFVVWGLLHGLFLCVHKYVGASTAAVPGSRARRLACIIGTHLLVSLTWIPFRCESLAQALGYVGRMFAFVGPWDPTMLLFVGILYGALLLIDLPIHRSANEFFVLRFPRAFQVSYFTLTAVVVLILLLTLDQAKPFIYFQF